MKTTPRVSAGFAQAACVAYGMSRRGVLAIRRDDRADARRRTTRVEPTQSTRRRCRPRYADLVRRTGRVAGWREWRESRRANRYSQEERVTSRYGPYAECYAMSNVIKKHLGARPLRCSQRRGLRHTLASHGCRWRGTGAPDRYSASGLARILCLVTHFVCQSHLAAPAFRE
jgi:hypothetical protein